MLAVAIVVMGCGGGNARERALCEQSGKVCGLDLGELDDCVKTVPAFKEPLGANSYDKLLACGTGAASCAEFVGCFAGGLDQAVEILGKQFERGFDKMTDHDPKHDGWTRHRDSTSTHSHSHSTTSSHDEPATTTCAKFSGAVNDAKWDDCTDHVRRELVCKSRLGDLECACIEDGVEKWRFDARDPRLDDQAEATRVARSNCHMSFEGF